MTRDTASRQRGFTLIELMVALLVSSLLVGMILAIFSRMSLAYRGQQQIAGVQQILAAARATIELDARQAGLGVPQGFKTALPAPPALQSPVQVTNNSAAPDQIALFYADTSVQALVTASNLTVNGTITVADTPVGFSAPMLVVLTTASTATNPLPGTNPDIATYDACVLNIAAVNAGARQITFDTVAPWGAAPGPTHCSNVIPLRTMMYRFVANAYRIDPTPARLALGVLQQSPTGGLLGNAEVWNDLALGFSDIQTAVRLYEHDSAVDPDGDGDNNRNWFSGANQDSATAVPAPGVSSALIGMSISLVAHTDRDVEGIATLATPNLLGAPTAANNPLGDRPSTVLPVATPGPPPVPPWPDPLLPGSRIYRYVTFQVDFRNLGVGVDK